MILLKKVHISSDSQLEIIEKFAFQQTLIDQF